MNRTSGLKVLAYSLLALAPIPVLLWVPRLLIAESVCVFAGCAIALFIAASALNGRVDGVLMLWMLIFPLGYYFLTFPRDRAVFTLDRALLGLLMLGIAFGKKDPEFILAGHLKNAGVMWALFLIAAAVSLRQMENPLGASKELIDAFALPAALAFYVIRTFPLLRWMRTMHMFICLMCAYVAAIGIAEFMTGRDLLELPVSTFIATETGDMQRVNGPFGSNNSFGLIGLLSALLLVFLRRALGKQMTAVGRLLHWVGLLSAVIATLLPMFRSIVLSVVFILLIEVFSNKKGVARLPTVALILAGIGGFYGLQQAAPEFFKSRVSDPSDLYARIAQHKQTLQLFISHPFNGVGLGNYPEAALAIPSATYHGVDSVGSAHNTLAALLADTGVTGFGPFVLAQMFLFAAFWRLRRRGTRQAQLGSTFFLYVFIAYWGTGVMLTSGYYSDINTWYAFVVGVLYKYALLRPAARAPLAREMGRARPSLDMPNLSPSTV